MIGLAACGGGGGGGSGGSGSSGGGASGSGAVTTSFVPCTSSLGSASGGTPTDRPTTQAEAARFLTQATFGPTPADIDRLMQIGYTRWFEEQFSASQCSHKAHMDGVATLLPAGSSVSDNQVYESFWRQAVTGRDQLRQRVAFALSQIFVVSLVDGNVAQYPRGVASYLDMLGNNAFGTYRQLIEDVSLHPMMGLYLSHLRNQKESGSRIPDQNYAREVMQLFSIGIYPLNRDGTVASLTETYTGEDVAGLSKVFTGFSWYAGPNLADRTDTRFFGGNEHPDRDWRPMQSYAKFHSTSEKTFLGLTIAAQSSANPEASLRAALDQIANHPNVGPFIAKQLIQRLVTSNPSAAYVDRVAQVFNNNGTGQRGDMRAVVRAILMDTEARSAANTSNPQFGKLREPILRLANWLRAFNASSTSQRFQITNLDDPLNGLAQTPMRSPSVFNFYRPGYVPPNTSLGLANLAAPEMQITHETSVVGYLNRMRDWIPNGVGNGRDVRANYSAELALANNADALIDRLNLLLYYGTMSTTLRTDLINAVNSVPLRTGTSNEAGDRRNRVHLAIFLALAAPEYLAQK